MLVLDPFAEEGVRAGLVGDFDVADVQRTNPAPLPISEVLGRLVNILERVLKVPVGGVFPVPLAVVVTKIDACGLADQLRMRSRPFGGSYYSMIAAAYDAERHSPRVRNFLLKAGMGNFLRIVESRFARVSYFGASSLGRSADPGDRSPFQPLGIPGPLVWLSYHAGALNAQDAWDKSFVNMHINFFRYLRGLEGEKSQTRAWWILACGLTLLLTFFLVLILSMPRLLFFLTVVLSGIPLLFLYGWCFWILVVRRHRY